VAITIELSEKKTISEDWLQVIKLEKFNLSGIAFISQVELVIFSVDNGLMIFSAVDSKQKRKRIEDCGFGVRGF